MKYLSPEIAAFYKDINDKSLVRSNVSCGIFQDCDYNEKRAKPFYLQQIEKKEI
jgi:hypothetical protein